MNLNDKNKSLCREELERGFSEIGCGLKVLQ